LASDTVAINASELGPLINFASSHSITPRASWRKAR
jgi:hypothetical protein